MKIILEILILLIGLTYASLIIKNAIKFGLKEKGKLWQMGLVEAFVYFCASMGFSDFTLNIPFWKKFGWVETRFLPPTLFACGIIPGCILGFYFLRNSSNLPVLMPILIIIASCAGSFTGSHFVQKLDARIVKKTLKIALMLSIVALIVKLVLSQGEPGTLTSLSPIKMAIALPLVFSLGFVNAFGAPTKPALTPLFLLLGLSPVITLTIILLLGVFSPASACVSIFKAKQYNKKLSVASLIFGSIGAALGCLFTVSLKPIVLTILFIIMIIIIYTI